MFGDYREAMDLWLVEVKHTYDEYYEIVGIFGNTYDVIAAKELYLRNKEEAGLSREEFTFKESKHVLGDINY